MATPIPACPAIGSRCQLESLESLVRAQRASFHTEGFVSARVRRDRLDRAIGLLVASQEAICEAVAKDFGQRPAELTRFMDIFPALHALKFARRNLERWMKPVRRRLGFPNSLPGTRGEIIYQPLGVVGVISPWNFPITLSFGPLAGILAAGNRCMIKPSELTPVTSALLADLIGKSFDPTEVAVVTGTSEVGIAFSRLPLDHLLFTGSTQVGRDVMAAAAEHLVPVTLELGGKCPAIVGRSADISRAVDRILLGKLANAGQVCLAPDYVCVPQEMVDAFVRETQVWAQRVYPGLPDNPDYTSLVSSRHRQRAEALLADARAQGAQVIPLGVTSAVAAADVLTPVLILGATPAMQVMREEIFAPLLPVLAYDRVETVISDIQQRARPLALYYFGSDKTEEREVLSRTVSGGVTVNDVAMHFLAEELPFGGVGPSGMGAYHGEHGFRRFSHARAVFRQSRFDVAGLTGLRPPYGARLRRSLSFLIRR
jgi:coniferyl-aldehyde dehydrogenase